MDSNNLILNEKLKNVQFKAYIPNYLLEKKEKNCHVDTFFDEVYLMNNIEYANNITEITSSKRKIFDKWDVEFIPMFL